MLIVPQSAKSSYSLSPIVPTLLLSAPRIAGLLPARIGPPIDTFHYQNARLDVLSNPARDRLFDAVTKLLDTAVLCLLHESSELALMNAESLFHDAVIGTPVIRPAALYQTREQMDDELRDFMRGAQQRIAARRDDILREVADRRQARERRDRLFSTEGSMEDYHD